MTTREKILDTALKMFLKKGFTDVSINEIIKKSGTSKGGFFHYFRDKNHILKEIIQNYIIPYIEVIEERVIVSQQSTFDKLNSFFNLIPESDRFLQDYLNDKTVKYRSLYLLMMEAVKKYSFFEKQYTRIFTKIFDLIKKQLAEGRKKGEISKQIDLDSKAYEILALYEGALHIWVIHPEMKLSVLNKKLLEDVWNSIKSKGAKK